MVRGLQKNGSLRLPQALCLQQLRETNRAYNDSEGVQSSPAGNPLKGFEICIAEWQVPVYDVQLQTKSTVVEPPYHDLVHHRVAR